MGTIFVTVGTAHQPFTRLLRAMDELARTDAFRDDSVFLQTGHADFRAAHCEQKAFLTREEFSQMIERAEVVVAHGGGATLLQVFATGNVPVAIPRLGSRDEAVDDHQVDLVRELAEQGRVVAAYTPEDLGQAIQEARRLSEHAMLDG